MATPGSILSSKRERIAALEANLANERAELRGMELMAQALVNEPRDPFKPITAREMTDADWKRSQESFDRYVAKGRQPGSMSKRWRAVLWRLDRMGGNFSPRDIVEAVRELEQRDIRPADAKRQMEGYQGFGFVVAAGDVFNVTDEFRSKFADWANGSDENEVSEADAADASDTGLEGLQRRPQE